MQTPDPKVKALLTELILLRLRDRSIVPIVVLDTLLTGVFSKDPNRRIHLPKSVLNLGNGWAWDCYSPAELKPRKASLARFNKTLTVKSQGEEKIRGVIPKSPEKPTPKPILKAARQTVQLRQPLAEIAVTPGIINSPASNAAVNEDNDTTTVAYPDPRGSGEAFKPEKVELPDTGFELPRYLEHGEVFTLLGKEYRWEVDPYLGVYHVSTVDGGIRELCGNPKGYKTKLGALTFGLGIDKPTAKAMLG